MRDPARIDRIIELLRQAWHLNPDQRLTQFLTNIVEHEVHHPLWEPPFPGMFYFEDDKLEQELNKLIARKGKV